jgi:hypothetical protein
MERDMRSGRFVAWANAVLAGLVSPDTAAERICGRDRPHRVACAAGGLGPGGSGDGASLPLVLAGLKAGGVRGLLLALPTPGDPLGLPGPPEFNETATAAGEAVLTVGPQPRGLVPEVIAECPDGPGGIQVVWHAHPVTPWVALDVPSLAEAERELTETLRRATEALADLDVARWGPEAAGRLSAIRAHDGAEGLAPGYPARAHRVLALAQRLVAITELAGADTGAAVTAREMEARAAELRPLARAARRAQVAAFNAVLEREVDAPPGRAAAVELDIRRG